MIQLPRLIKPQLPGIFSNSLYMRTNISSSLPPSFTLCFSCKVYAAIILEVPFYRIPGIHHIEHLRTVDYTTFIEGEDSADGSDDEIAQKYAL
jgi:hypothetical protein